MMPELVVIRQPLSPPPFPGEKIRVILRADRLTLTKRRWRGTAEDGAEFGFDLDHALGPGIAFHEEAGRIYFLEQTPEQVLEIPVLTLEQSTQVAWNLGNLHLLIQVLPNAVRVPEDPAALQWLARERMDFQRVHAVFVPLSPAAHTHHHQHA